MKAIVISIGDELILGKTVDTNSAYLAQELGKHGLDVIAHHTVADRIEAISAEIRSACEQADYVVITGGLGPTKDDLTRQALAEVMGVPLELHQGCLDKIKELFKRRNWKMVAANQIQAMLPAGTQPLPNEAGTAPGISAKVGNTLVVVMPGVPYEMKQMFDLQVRPLLPKDSGSVVQLLLHTFGAGESDVGERIGDLMESRDGNIKVGTTVAAGMVSIRITVSGADTNAQALQQAESVADQIRQRLGDLVLGSGTDTLAFVVGKLLSERKQTFATAESCTGGMVGQLITAISGSSEYYVGGVVSYSNALKQSLLGVSLQTLESFGAVSEPVAKEMALGCRERLNADWAVSLTGIAGPTGGTEEKPVGLVYIGLAGPDGVQVHRHLLSGNRDRVRQRAALAALNHLRLALLKGGVSA